MTDIQCVVDAKALLGEGVCWDAHAQCLWWLDIWAQAIHRYEPKSGQTHTFSTPMRPGCLAVRQRGGIVLGMGDGFYFADTSRGHFESIVNVEADIPETRMNDGKTDRQGRFWSGTVFECEGKTPQPVGSLYRLDASLASRKAATGFICSNGLAWSPDSRRLYFTDSATPYVWRWDFDASTGEVADRRVFIDLSSEQAVCDGATVDAAGCYWLTLPFKGKVQQYDPDGKLMRAIILPTDTPTCCEFGGPELEVLYVTTATLRRPPSELRDQPWAGGLLAIDTGAKGLPSAAFVG